MKALLAFAGALMLALGLFLSPDVGAAPPSRPVTQSAARVQKGEGVLEVVLDLAAAEPGEPLTVAVPAEKRFRVVVVNRAPSGPYRMSHDASVDNPVPGVPLAMAWEGTLEAPIPTESHMRVQKISPACEALQEAAHGVLRSRDEGEVEERLSAFREEEEKEACPRLAQPMSGTVAFWEKVQLRPIFSLQEEETLRVTVERLDPGTRDAVQTWHLLVGVGSTVSTPQPVSSWAYANEEAWIVGETSRDVVEMLLFARGGTLPPPAELGFSAAARAGTGGALEYEVVYSPGGNARRSVLTFDSHIWSPATYEPLAADLLQHLGLEADEETAAAGLAETLTRPLGTDLARQSERLSKRLGESMLDPGAHEQAALLVGALALREGTGGYTDIRHSLCRMSAHLSVARALRQKEFSRLADYAEALLLTLVKRERDALASIEGLERRNPPGKWRSFLRALRIRNTRDWRILQDPVRATLLERLEHYRALQLSLGSARALAFFETFPAEPIADWGLISFEGVRSVEAGQMFADSLTVLDMTEAAEVWGVLGDEDVTPDRLAGVLNAVPQRLISGEEGGRALPHVIDEGAWARYVQRRLCFASEAITDFLASWRSLPERADELSTLLDEGFLPLELWPMVRLEWLRTAVGPGKGQVLGRPGRDPCPRAVALARTAPERISPQHWLRVRRLCVEDRDAEMARQWVGNVAPLGTALTDWDRILLIPEDPQRPVAGTLEELAPFSLLTVQYLLPARDKASYEELKADYGPLADYDLRAMDQVAQARRDDPAAFRALYEKIAKIEPGRYVQLGDYLVDVGLEDEAAAAYESAVEKARDRIAVTRSVRWLVGYYLDRSHTHRARELAEQAAGVGSDSGFRVMGYFLERTGRYAEAEKWYRKLIERYGQNGRAALDAFYIRYQVRVGDGRFAGEAAEALASVFPAGLERVSIEELTTPPAPGEGVRVSGKYQRTTRFGLLKGDVVVALNGYRVYNDTQYALLWTLDDRPEATAIAWRETRYIEVEGRLKTLSYGLTAPGSSEAGGSAVP